MCVHVCRFLQTEDQFKNTYLTYKSNDHGNYTDQFHDPSIYFDNIPSSMDWRTKGAVGTVKNQVAH